MRRAAVRAFRTTNQQHTVRGLFRPGYRSALGLQAAVRPQSSSSSSSRGYHGYHYCHYHAHFHHRAQHLRCLSTSSALAARRPLVPPAPFPPRTQRTQPSAGDAPLNGEPLHASMYVRRLSVALVSGLVGYGAYYAYQGEGPVGGGKALFSTKAPSVGAVTGVTTTTSPSTTTGASTASTKAADAAVTSRNVLVIGADELSTGTLIGDGPIAKLTDDAGRRVIEMLNPDQVTQWLRRNEESYAINRGQGVLRYDLVQLASNNPIEDDHAEKIVEVPAKGSAAAGGANTTDWMFWGVFDGHSGWTTSAKLRQALINYVACELNDTYKAAPGDQGPPADAVEGAIKVGFTRLDDDIVNRSAATVLQQKSKTVAAELLAPALSGSCALLAFYESRSQLLRVACTGDSRAVLGRRAASGKWTATPLSVDQTGNNPDEAARLRQQHPGEEHVVRNGRVLGGLEPTRAFGDATYKWTRAVSDRLRESFFGRSQSPLMRTPPYVTAEPVVTTTRIEPANGDFVVMATDGLWEMLTNEEAVGLVGKWIEAQAAEAAAATSTAGRGSQAASNAIASAWSKVFGGSGSGGSGAGALPVEAPVEGSANKNGERTPIRLRQWGISPEDNGRFVVKDKNVATHLVRNALGGSNEEQVSALLTLPAPFSRRYRDDLTVQVIFFGNGNPSGGVALNQEATGPGASIKAKL
ncbi:protein phosphatase 2c [Niveomyces insectorum RCEF 264]|uniref:Protein phosphatase 2c n=1 Tax=Niveomyces insectorum RCEF 264 TaxID=1081102 RepID=A0A167X1L9_9HYPO|nr:protein phosphatase 2c [Niveomyces insectorum RCEF 264]